MTDDICSQEPIHTPGSIQPHGILLGLNCADLSLVTHSVNLTELCPGLGRGEALHALPPAVAAMARSVAAGNDGDEATLFCEFDEIGPREVHCFRAEGTVFIEFDKAAPDLSVTRMTSLALEQRQWVDEFRDCPEPDALGRKLVQRIRDVTGFERVLLYRFDDDGHGDVVAESLVDDWSQSLMGLHFPASDIPAQARSLYTHVKDRWSPRRDCERVALIPAHHPATGRPFDIGFSRYRSISPAHTLYQRNLGVDGAMTMSVMLDKSLWGLVVGHHRRPHSVEVATRLHVGTLVDSFSCQLINLIRAEAWDAQVGYIERHRQFLSKLAAADDYIEAMTLPPMVATDMFGGCSGAAIVHFDERRQIAVRTVGASPPSQDVLKLLEWLRACYLEAIVATDCISSIYPAFERHRDMASGVMAAFIGESRDQAILWFRPEIIREINWGGKPEKVADSSGTTFLPRRSFERWIEQRHGHSLRWLPWEIHTAAAFATTLSKVVLRQNRQIKELNSEVERFLWVTSHHLREVPRNIQIKCQQVQRHAGEALGADAQALLNELREEAKAMDLRLKGLIVYSEFGHSTSPPVQIPLADVVTQAIGQLDGMIHSTNASIRVLGDLPEVISDSRALALVFHGLIENALRFRSPKRPPDIRIWAERLADMWLVSVGDNGVGIEQDFLDRVFNLFETLGKGGGPGQSGIGIGLTLCRRIVVRLGGRIWLSSKPDHGTTVQFLLPVLPRQKEAGEEPPRVSTVTLIREATRELHTLIEHHPIMMPMAEGRVTPEEYRLALAALFGFYRPCEELLFSRFPMIAQAMGIRPKLPALIHDLLGLGMADTEIQALLVSPRIPEIASWAQALGMAYVLEGATLGGQVVIRRIAHCLGPLVGMVTDFHNFQGDQAGVNWRRFQALLSEQLEHSAEAQMAASEAAAETFRALTTWLDTVAQGGCHRHQDLPGSGQ